MYYPAFKQQMVLLFVTTRIKQREAKLKLFNRNQAEDESITRYCYELMNLANANNYFWYSIFVFKMNTFELITI